VMVQSDDNQAETAADIMSRHNVIDIDRRGESYRSSGWKGYNESDQPYTQDELSSFSSTRTTAPRRTSDVVDTDTTTRRTSDIGTTGRTTDLQGEQTLPVVEENLQVGKRQVETGRARIHTKITETPVEEQVNLREEHVNVERRPVDRPVTDADKLFREQSFEVTETAEQAVVSKQARVIEEVVVNKDVTDRTETVRDTVRRQDVHVHDDQGADVTERSGGVVERSVGNTSGYDAYDNDFRSHYQTNYASSGQDYSSYSPVYRYGYNLANDTRYSGQDWNTVETDARTRWEERNPGTWEQFKEGVRYAWDKARGRA